MVRLAALDSQGGRVEVVLQIDPLPKLPEIEAPHPLLAVAGQTQTAVVRRVAFVESPLAGVTWTATEVDIPGVSVELTAGADGSVEVAVTATLAVPAGTEFSLELTATDEHDQRQTVELPVTVLAAEPRPRLSLSVKAGADRTISSLIATDILFIEAELNGASDPLTTTIRINNISFVPALVLWESTTVRVGAEPSLVMVPLTALTALAEGDLVEVSIEAPGNVASARLRLQVAAAGTTLGELIDKRQ